MVCLARNAIYLKQKVGLGIRNKIKLLYMDDYRQRYQLPDMQLLSAGCDDMGHHRPFETAGRLKTIQRPDLLLVVLSSFDD